MKGIRASLICKSAEFSAQNGAKCCMWGGGGGEDRAEAIGEVGRCPQEPPGLGPNAVRMASVAIRDVAVESRMEGAGEDSELVGGGASEVVTVMIPFVIDLVVAMMVFWRGLAGARGSENRKRGRGNVRFFF